MTSLIIPFGELAAPLEPFRGRHVNAAALAMPPHVTIHFPFKPPADLSAEIIAELARMFARFPAFACGFGATATFPAAGVLYLVPEPAAPFLAMSREIRERYPEAPAHYPEPVFHLTVAQGYRGAALAELAAAFQRDYAPLLPLKAVARGASLYLKRGGTWSEHSAFPFAG